MVDWDAVACACGCPVTDIPQPLVGIFEELDKKIKDANGMKFGDREDYGLRSTQIVGLVIFLWELGILT